MRIFAQVMCISVLNTELPFVLPITKSLVLLTSCRRDVHTWCHVCGSHLCNGHGTVGASSRRFFPFLIFGPSALLVQYFFHPYGNGGTFVSRTGGYSVTAQPASSISIASTEISLFRKNYSSQRTPGWCSCIKEF